MATHCSRFIFGGDSPDDSGLKEVHHLLPDCIGTVKVTGDPVIRTARVAHRRLDDQLQDVDYRHALLF